jgi:hypothetical protein
MDRIVKLSTSNLAVSRALTKSAAAFHMVSGSYSVSFARRGSARARVCSHPPTDARGAAARWHIARRQCLTLPCHGPIKVKLDVGLNGVNCGGDSGIGQRSRGRCRRHNFPTPSPKPPPPAPDARPEHGALTLGQRDGADLEVHQSGCGGRVNGGPHAAATSQPCGQHCSARHALRARLQREWGERVRVIHLVFGDAAEPPARLRHASRSTKRRRHRWLRKRVLVGRKGANSLIPRRADPNQAARRTL